MPVLFSATTTAQQIINSTAQDVRQTMSATDPTSGQLTMLDYVDRISKELLRASRWQFLLSAPRTFLTQLGVSNYWVGPVGTGPVYSAETGLNISNLRIIKPKSVYDRSNFTVLGHVDEQPLSARLAYPDSTSRPGRPSMWRQDESNPNVFNIYPAPDNQNTYTPQPEPPICTTTIGGSLPARIYFVSCTFVDSLGGETTAPSPTQVFVPANSLLTVNAPTPFANSTTGIKYDRYNVYANSVGTSEVAGLVTQNLILQSSLNSFPASWTESTSGLTTVGVNPPSTNGAEPMDGYFIEFRYYAQRTPVLSLNQVLQVPDDYKDVMIAGVNALTFDYLTRAPDAQKWYAIYKDGITQMIRDINFMAKGGEYIQPDAATIGNNLPAVETIDLSYLTT